MLSDIEIAQAAEMKPITEIAGKLGLPSFPTFNKFPS